MCINRQSILFISLFLFLNNQLFAQNETDSDSSFDTIIVPGPIPFSLDAISAINCIELLRRNRFIQVNDENGTSYIVKVQTVWSISLGLNESYPGGHQRRYDIVLNGKPLDWDHSYVEYGGEMINLRLLYLYRNQYPPQGLKYYNKP